MKQVITYERYEDVKGKERFRRILENGQKRMIAKTDIPSEELKLLYSNEMDALDALEVETVDDDDNESGQSEQVSTDCVFGDGYGNRRKFLQGKIVRLCEEHWQTKTTGEIVGQLNGVEQVA